MNDVVEPRSAGAAAVEAPKLWWHRVAVRGIVNHVEIEQAPPHRPVAVKLLITFIGPAMIAVAFWLVLATILYGIVLVWFGGRIFLPVFGYLDLDFEHFLIFAAVVAAVSISGRQMFLVGLVLAVPAMALMGLWEANKRLMKLYSDMVSRTAPVRKIYITPVSEDGTTGAPDMARLAGTLIGADLLQGHDVTLEGYRSRDNVLMVWTGINHTTAQVIRRKLFG